MAVSRELIDQLRHLLRPIANRVVNTVARGVVSLVDDSKRMQLVQLGVLAGETVDGAEHFQPYGFFAIPLPGAEHVTLFPNGDRSHPITVVIADRRHRPLDGEPGEAGLATDEGDEIRLARGNVIVLDTSGEVKLGSPSASDGAIKGTQRNTAEQVFLTAMSAFATAIVDVTGIPAPAKATFIAAINAFKTAAGNAVSTKIKLE
jgi:phage baseplate assembly protein V